MKLAGANRPLEIWHLPTSRVVKLNGAGLNSSGMRAARVVQGQITSQQQLANHTKRLDNAHQ